MKIQVSSAVTHISRSHICDLFNFFVKYSQIMITEVNKMKEHITYNGINYTLQGDYYLPDLKLPEQDDRPIGIWGERHKRYIKQYHKVRYTNLLTSCKLVEYLADINEQAEIMYEMFVNQSAEKEGVTEKLKSENPFLWVKHMNNIHNRAREIVILVSFTNSK